MTTFKELCEEMLKEENYIEALAYCCERLLKVDPRDREDEVEHIDDVLWAMANDSNIGEAMEQEIRIYSALKIIIFEDDDDDDEE